MTINVQNLVAKKRTTVSGIRMFSIKMYETGFIVDAAIYEHSRVERLSEDIETVDKSMCENPSTIILYRSQKFNISRILFLL